MPALEYECPACGAKFEKIQPRYKDSPELCKECGKPAKLVVSVPSGMIWGKNGGFNR